MNRRLRWVLPVLATTSVILAFTPPRALAQWQWTDEHGRPVFSDLPPPKDIPPERIIQRPDLSVRGKAREVTPSVNPAASATAPDAATKPQDAAKATKPTANAAQRSQECRSLQSGLELLRKNLPLPHVDEQGRRTIMNAEQRAAQIKAVEGMMKQYCQ